MKPQYARMSFLECASLIALSNLKAASSRRTPKCSKAGMTLIELIITLTIMAAVASIAIVTLSDMGETSRYEETERRGLAAQRAVIGQPGEISRFFNDMGRYPMVLVDIGNGTTDDADDILRDWVLAELFNIDLETVDEDDNPVNFYTSTESDSVRHMTRSIATDLEFRFDLPSDTTPQDNDFVNGTDATTINNLLIHLRAGWDGPYLLNQYDRFTDNYGLPWAINTNGTKSVWGGAESGWTSLKTEDSFGNIAPLDPLLGEPIKAIRSDYPVGIDGDGSLLESTDFSDVQKQAKYKAEVENQTYVFHENYVLPDLTVQLYDANGVELKDSSKAAFDRIRVMLYVPLCNQGVEPEICEVAAWMNFDTDVTISAQGVRYRISDYASGTLGAASTEYELRVEDKDKDGDFQDADEWEDWSGSDVGLLDVIETQCQPTDSSDTSIQFIPWKSISEVDFQNVPVGTRKIWAYAYENSTGDATEWYSTIQQVEIKPGHNVVTLYLTENEGF